MKCKVCNKNISYTGLGAPEIMCSDCYRQEQLYNKDILAVIDHWLNLLDEVRDGLLEILGKKPIIYEVKIKENKNGVR